MGSGVTFHRWYLAAVCLFSAHLFLLIIFSGNASEQSLSGIVTNATNDKPAAGDEVILIRLAQGMDEAARTKTDSSGNFSFKLDDAGAPHLLEPSTRACPTILSLPKVMKRRFGCEISYQAGVIRAEVICEFL
jgi:hypothetical protein